jgi:ssRNA-specific RNase YbeY (16S rRNA maturation enzyme)
MHFTFSLLETNKIYFHQVYRKRGEKSKMTDVLSLEIETSNFNDREAFNDETTGCCDIFFVYY